MEQKVTWKDWAKFILVMVVFIIGMIILMINKLDSWYIWIPYIAVWWWLEMKIAKNIHLKWWVWVIILFGLTLLDLLIIDLIH